MKILVITYYWPPSGGAGVQRWLKFVKYLADFGIQPIVLTVDPNYAEYPVLDPSLETDVSPDLLVYRTRCKGVYDLYKKVTGSKTAPYSGFANESEPGFMQKISRFVRGNFFLPDARRGWIKYAFAKACKIIEEHEINAVITTGPPHSTHLTGLKIKKKYGIKWIVDFRDPWTTIFYNDALFQTRMAIYANQRMEQSVIDACDRLLLVSVDREKIYADVNKTTFLPNGYDDLDFANQDLKLSEIFTVCYTGTIAASYPTEALAAAFEALHDIIAYKLIFVGKVADTIKNDINNKLKSAAKFLGYMPHKETVNYMSSSHLLLLIIPQTESNKFIIPGKLFEYLATGRQVLVIGPLDSAVAQIVAQSNAGATFDYNDTEGMKNYILQTYHNYTGNCPPVTNREYIEQFSRKRLTRRLSEIIMQ